MKSRWYKDAVIYQIYPRSFKDSNGDGIGDLMGITSKLDYLAELGVNAVWLSPCYKSPGDDNGYDISDYRDIMTDFGTLDDWKLMIREMHARGIKLVMDLVVNHSSDEHEWFTQSASSIDNPYRKYYIWHKGRKDGTKPPNNWRGNFLGSAWQKHEATGEYYLHLFSKKQPDLNWDNPKLRQEIVDISNYWLDLGVDGFRCDVITYISKTSGLPDGKKNRFLVGAEHYVLGHHWKEYISELNDKSWAKHDTLIVGECALIDYNQAMDITDESKGLLDTSFTFEAALSDKFGFKLSKIKKIYQQYQSCPKECWTSSYLENHDQPRCLPRYADANKFRYEAATMLATMIFFHRGTPYIYQGQEIGMTNCNFAEGDYRDIMSTNIIAALDKFKPVKKFGMKMLGKFARDNARTPMQWDASENAGFTKGTPWMCVNPNYTDINVDTDRASDKSVFNYYKALIKHRSTVLNIISDGLYKDHSIKSNQIYQYTHTLGRRAVVVQLNFTDKTLPITSPISGCTNCGLIISNYKSAANEQPSRLRPYEAVAYLVELE